MRIKLCVSGVCEIVGGCGMALIMLTDEKRSRLMAIVSDQLSGREIVMRVAGAPKLQQRLPETLVRISGISEETHEIIVYDVYGGEYKTALHHKYEDTNMPLRVSDAVLLSLVAHLDILMEENFFQKQSVPYDAKAHSMALPINSLNTKMLKGALQKAIDEENYEMASQIRDELNKRKTNNEP